MTAWHLMTLWFVYYYFLVVCWFFLSLAIIFVVFVCFIFMHFFNYYYLFLFLQPSSTCFFRLSAWHLNFYYEDAREMSRLPKKNKWKTRAHTKDLRHKLVLWSERRFFLQILLFCCCSTTKMQLRQVLASIDRRIYWFLETAKNSQTPNACKYYSAHTQTHTCICKAWTRCAN